MKQMTPRWWSVAGLGLVAGALVLAQAAWAQVPHLIRYQGQAVDSQGVPLEGPYTLMFRLYDAETAGTKVWEEAQPNVLLQSGHFSVLLGQVTPLNGMNWGVPCWLSVQVGTEPELGPRQRITSVPMAISAERLETSGSISPHNLLLNGSFESWSQGPVNAPDGWDNGGYGNTALSQVTTAVAHGQAAVQVTNSAGGGAAVRQWLASVISDTENTAWRGRTFTFSGKLKTSLAGQVRLCLDGIQTACSTPHTGSGAFETLSVTTTVPVTATYFQAFLWVQEGSPSTSVTMDGAMLVEGPLPFAFSPHPLDQQPSITNFQTTSGTNLTDQGNFRMEIGEVSLAGNPSESGVSKLVTFKTAFRTIRAVFISNGTYSGGWGGIIGGRRVAWSASEFTTTGFRAAALTTDGGNFLSTSPGNACWLAIGQ